MFQAMAILLIGPRLWSCYCMESIVPEAQGSEMEQQELKGGIAPGQKDALPMVKLDAAGVEASPECPICLDMFAVGDDVKKLPCGHVFHFSCMEQWGQASDKCKVCDKGWKPK
eukprot:TRINITY_DN12004_c0_g1_i1.p1 TRINITY_DN12004_c0_g1~~TRINITY_DN12004_c0_g1_i1.p1  ORF type:complete len:113 (+),score=28.10 TRINITY_DN12004_c0_g1_i1:54-392(+)